MSLGSHAYRQGAVLTAVPFDLARKALEASLREAIALSSGRSQDLDRLRKLLSLARQTCRPGTEGLGRDLSELCAHMLVRLSRAEADALPEAVGLLSLLVAGFREWHTTNSGGIVRPWIGASSS